MLSFSYCRVDEGKYCHVRSVELMRVNVMFIWLS